MSRTLLSLMLLSLTQYCASNRYYARLASLRKHFCVSWTHIYILSSLNLLCGVVDSLEQFTSWFILVYLTHAKSAKVYSWTSLFKPFVIRGLVTATFISMTSSSTIFSSFESFPHHVWPPPRYRPDVRLILPPLPMMPLNWDGLFCLVLLLDLWWAHFLVTTESLHWLFFPKADWTLSAMGLIWCTICSSV